MTLNEPDNSGISYDLELTTRDQFILDWQPYFVAADLQRLTTAVGLRGADAKVAAERLKDIFVPYKAALAVFEISTANMWLSILDKAMPGAERLPKECTGALLSLVYDRGPRMSGDPGREMTLIRGHVASREFEKIPQELRAMKRLGKNRPNFTQRREAEARLCEDGLAKLKDKSPPASGASAEQHESAEPNHP
jgi:hypothetical protein